MCSSCLPCTATNCAQVLCVFETRDTLVVEMFDPAVATAAIAADSRLAQGGSIPSSVDTEGGDFAELQCPTVAINEMYRRTNPEVSYSRPGDEFYGRFTPPGSRLLPPAPVARRRPPFYRPSPCDRQRCGSATPWRRLWSTRTFASRG